MRWEEFGWRGPSIEDGEAIPRKRRMEDGGTPGSPSTTTSEGEWISGRWSPGGMEEKWRGKLLFSNSQQQDDI